MLMSCLDSSIKVVAEIITYVRSSILEMRLIYIHPKRTHYKCVKYIASFAYASLNKIQNLPMTFCWTFIRVDIRLHISAWDA